MYMYAVVPIICEKLLKFQGYIMFEQVKVLTVCQSRNTDSLEGSRFFAPSTCILFFSVIVTSKNTFF